MRWSARAKDVALLVLQGLVTFTLLAILLGIVALLASLLSCAPRWTLAQTVHAWGEPCAQRKLGHIDSVVYCLGDKSHVTGCSPMTCESLLVVVYQDGTEVAHSVVTLDEAGVTP